MILKFNLCNLLLILIPSLILTVIIIRIAQSFRVNKILNPEDHDKRNIIEFLINLLLFIFICAFTPIVIGVLFWTGIFLIVMAGVIYILSIIAFLKNKNGLITNGIYSVTRNPMYIAMAMFLNGFLLMTLGSNLVLALLMGIIIIGFIRLIHVRVLNEERFLLNKYKGVFSKYCENTPRYIFNIKNMKSD